MRFAKVFLMVFIFLGSLILPACVVVQPYEREILADPIMMFEYDELNAAYMTKMLETREGSAGGTGGASGGCGCK